MNQDGGQQNFSIRLLNEQLRRDAQNSINQFNRIGTAATNAGTTVDRSMGSMSKSVTGAIRTMTNGVTSAMQEMAKNMLGITALLSSGAFLKDLYAESKAFNREMKVVSTISEEVTQNMEKYKGQVLQLCTQLAVAPDTAAQALYQINSAGHLGADGMKVLESSARAAIGGVTETATAADAITTILNAYHKSADEAESISDKLFTTVRLGKTTMGELGQNISTVAPLAARYKISIDEILAAVAQLTKQGNNTASAMTQISASIIAVANELGDDAFQNGLMAGLDEIEKRANGSNMALKAQLSNIRAVRGAMGLTGESAKETAEMIEQIRDSAGATAEACAKMNSSASAEARKLKTNFLKEFASMGDGMSKTLAALSRTLNQAFESGEMSQVLSVLKDLIITYGIYKTLIITVTALNKVYKNVMNQVAYQKAMAATQQKALNTQEALGAVVTTNLKRAVQALNLALKQNAFGLVVAAVASAAYGIYKFCTRVSEAEKATKRLQEATSKMTQEATDERKKVLELLTVLKTAKKDTNDYKTAKQKIIDQYGTYLSKITNEQGEITNLAEAYRILTDEINRAARARAMEDLNAEAASDLANSNKSESEQLKKWLSYQGVSDSDAELATDRILTSIRTTGELPAGIQQQYGLTANVVENALRERFMSQSGYTPEVQQKNANNAVAAWRRVTKGKTNLSESEVTSLLGQAGYGEYASLLNNGELLYRRYAQSAMNSLLGNQRTYDNTIKQNELYTGMKAPDASMFEGIDPEHFEDNLNYLKNTVLPGFENGTYKNGNGISFSFTGSKKQTFKTEEELQSFIQQMEIELQNRQAAAALGTGGEGSGNSETKTIAEQVAEMISQSKNETNADKLKQLKEKMKEMLDGGQIDINSKDYTDLSAAYKALKKRFPGSDGGNSSDTPEQLRASATAAHQTELDLIDSQTRERIRAAQDAEFQVEQAKIDAMENSADKILKQRELDYQKQRAELQREMEDAILEEIARQKALFDAQEETAAAEAKRNGNKNYAKRTFNSGGLLATTTIGENGEATQNYTAGQLLAQGTIGDVDTTVINEILDRYEGLYVSLDSQNELYWSAAKDRMDEYLREFGTYTQKRQAIIDLANAEAEKAETQGERNSIFAKMRQELDDLDFNQFMTEKAALAFGDISRLSQQTITELIAEMEKYRVKIMQTYDPTKIDKFNQALRKLKNSQELNETSVWSNFIPQELREQAARKKELIELQKQYDGLVAEQKNKEEEVKQKIQEIIEKAKELTGQDFTASDVANPGKFQQTIDGLKDSNPDGAGQLQGIADELGGMQTELGGIEQAAGEAGSALQGMAGAGGGGMDTLAAVGAIVHKINESVQSAAELMHDLGNTAEALGADTEVGSGWDTATTVMDGFAEASEGATKAFDSFKSGNPIGVIQGVVQSFTAWIRTFATIHDAKHERKIQQIQEQIEDLEDAYKRLDRQIDKAYSRDASKLLNQQAEMIQNQRKLIQTQIEEEKAKKNSDKDKIKEWERKLKDLEEDYEDAKEAAIDAIFGEDVKAAIDRFAEAYESMFDGGTSRARASKDLVKDMIKNMILEAMKSDISKPMEKLRKLMESFWRDEEISDHEKEVLEGYVENMFEEQERKWGWADGYLKGSTSQSSSKGGFTTMSQDSADELNGRFTALQMTGEQVKTTTVEINEQLKAVVSRSIQTASAVDEIRGLQLIAVDHLETIRKHTANLDEMNERLGKIEQYTRRI